MRQPTQQDVADLANVSRALVSLVMRNAPNVSEGRRRAVLEAAAELNYRPNAAAQHLASRRTRIIGFLIEDLRNPFFAEVAEGSEAVAREHDYRLLINTGHLDARLEAKAIEAFLELRADGLVLSSESGGVRRIEEVGRTVPTVIVGRPIRCRTADTIHTDDRRGGRLAVEHLIGLGHRRIAHIGVANRSSSTAARLAGYRDAMTAAGLGEHVQAGRAAQDADAAARAVDRLLTTGTPPTAIFAANDLMALAVWNRLEDLGLAVPGDISLVGYDNTALAGIRHVDLTSVDQPRRRMGELALVSLIERIEGRRKPRETVLEPRLVARRTSGPPTSVRMHRH